MNQKRPTVEELCELLQRERIVEVSGGLQPEDDLFAAGMDSMAVMQLMVVVEEVYGVLMDPGDLTKENLGTAQSLARLIQSK